MNLPKINTANKKNALVIYSTIFFIFVNVAMFSTKTKAAALYLNPATGSVLTSTFELSVSLDAESDLNLKNVDTYINFDNTLVQVERIDKLALTSNATATYNNSLGTIHIKGDFSTTPAASSITNFAKIYLSTKPNSKGKAVSFIFEEGTGKTIVNTATNTAATLKTVGSDLLIDVMTTQNTSITQTSTNTNIPKTGNSDYLYFLLALLASITIVSLIFRKNVISKL